jgi:hypothetical protein
MQSATRLGIVEQKVAAAATLLSQPPPAPAALDALAVALEQPARLRLADLDLEALTAIAAVQALVMKIRKVGQGPAP